MKNLFTESESCLLMVHCPTCRDRKGGAAWRDMLRAAFRLPGDETDFECPHGAKWGRPMDRGFGDTLERLFKAIGFKKKCGGCKKRRDKLNKLMPSKAFRRRDHGSS